ncbi:uncharacterized protein LOC119555923 [Drosophila subpulchrella]|uniref:uncharacterized protein LOC119555923 n=1 Tax=Drosophila subpulchrella TaxID=1486046 RepID=UPI0018A1584D|nr:uncharacterized protein LOC119555923 [Drosophila subpulchrella]
MHREKIDQLFYHIIYNYPAWVKKITCQLPHKFITSFLPRRCSIGLGKENLVSVAAQVQTFIIFQNAVPAWVKKITCQLPHKFITSFLPRRSSIGFGKENHVSVAAQVHNSILFFILAETLFHSAVVLAKGNLVSVAAQVHNFNIFRDAVPAWVKKITCQLPHKFITRFFSETLFHYKSEFLK